MDGRVLPVLVGPTGHPPKTYRIPVPDAAGGPPTVLVYRRVPRERSEGVAPRVRERLRDRLGLPRGWKYRFDPEDTSGGRPRWPWSKPQPRTGTSGKPEDTEG
jgi:hypothetical protein